MKICLISPQRLLELNVPTLKSTPPLGLALIAGALHTAKHEITVVDAIAESPYQIFPFDEQISVNGLTFQELIEKIPSDIELIGFSFMFSNNWLLYRQLIEIVGNTFPNALIMAGGEHITAIPELCFKQTKQLDIAVLGEGEETVTKIVEVLEANGDLETVDGIVYRTPTGEIKTTPRRNRIREISKIPKPLWSVFPLDNYEKYKLAWGVDRGKSIPIMATRGCPYQCTFCSSPQMWTTRYMMREPKEVLEEISYLYHTYDIRNFDFYDLTAIIKRNWILDFCKVLVESGLKITWQIPAGTRSEAIDYEVATWLYKAGCRNITYAPESGSLATLKTIKKKVNLNNILHSIADSRKAGLNIKLNMIVGFPCETHRNIWETLLFLIKASWYGAHDAIPAIFSPYPGSQLFNELWAQGELDPYDDTYFRNLVFYDSFTHNKIYNKQIAARWVRFYQFFSVLLFYTSNYTVRPWRPFRTISNLVKGKHESRAEDTFADLLNKKKVMQVVHSSHNTLQHS